MYTCWHIVTIVTIIFCALLRRSFLSFGYVIILAPFIATSRNVLDQYDFYLKAVKDVNEIREREQRLKKKEDKTDGVFAWFDFATQFYRRLSKEDVGTGEFEWKELEEIAEKMGTIKEKELDELKKYFNELPVNMKDQRAIDTLQKLKLQKVTDV